MEDVCVLGELRSGMSSNAVGYDSRLMINDIY